MDAFIFQELVKNHTSASPTGPQYCETTSTEQICMD